MSKSINLDYLNLPDPNTTTATYYIKDGVAIDRDEYDNKSQVCAKKIVHNETKITSYFVLCNQNNQLYNPNDIDPGYKRSLWRFIKVKHVTFYTYISFLENKYRSLLSQAEREL